MKRRVGNFLCDVFVEDKYFDLRELRNLERLANKIIVNARVNGHRYAGQQIHLVHLLAKHRHDELVFNYKVRKNWSRVDVELGQKIITLYVNEELLTKIKTYERAQV